MSNEEDFEDDLTYPQEDIERFVQDTAEEYLQGQQWDEIKVPTLINQICESLMGKLNGLGKPYKFVVTCVL